MPMISIIVPVYNTYLHIEKCIDSCLKQGFANFELIIIDDGSEETTFSLLDFYAKKDNRIKVYHKENEGVAQARLDGVKLSTGDYLMFLDSDDYLENNALEILYIKAKSSHCDIVVGAYKEVYLKRKQVIIRNNPVLGFIAPTVYIDLILQSKVQWGVCCKLYRKELFNNLLSVNFKLGEDASLLVQLISNSTKIYFTNDLVYNYLQRAGSAVHSKPSIQLLDIYLFRVWIINFLLSQNINSMYLDSFVLNGYIECEFAGGFKYLPSSIRDDIHLLWLKHRSYMPKWKSILYVSFYQNEDLGNLVLDFLILIMNIRKISI